MVFRKFEFTRDQLLKWKEVHEEEKIIAAKGDTGMFGQFGNATAPSKDKEKEVRLTPNYALYIIYLFIMYL